MGGREKGGIPEKNSHRKTVDKSNQIISNPSTKEG
jgi:hypothetical protein